jgi:hypothetical protein
MGDGLQKLNRSSISPCIPSSYPLEDEGEEEEDEEEKKEGDSDGDEGEAELEEVELARPPKKKSCCP